MYCTKIRSGSKRLRGGSSTVYRPEKSRGFPSGPGRRGFMERSSFGPKLRVEIHEVTFRNSADSQISTYNERKIRRRKKKVDQQPNQRWGGGWLGELRNEEIRSSGMDLMEGVDIVPSECLAAQMEHGFRF